MVLLLDRIERLKVEAQANRQFEGFLRDFCERKGPDGEELYVFFRSRSFSPIARIALLQIEAIEDALIAYVARCWDEWRQLESTGSGKDADKLSLPNVRNKLVDLLSSDNNSSLIALLGHPPLVRAIERDGIDRTRERIAGHATLWLKSFDAVWLANADLVKRLMIFRHENIGHAISEAQSGDAKNFLKTAEEGASLYPNRGELLSLSAATGDLIDRLSGLLLTSKSSSPDKFANHDGDEYWAVLVSALK